MKLDAARSRLAIYTMAEGLFSALAHDLELVAGDLQGEGDEPSAEVRVPVASIRVTGVMKRGKLDTGVLSSADRESIERQIRDDVLPGPEVVARGTLEGGRASIEIVGPRGKTRVTCDLSATSEQGGKRVRGHTEVSLAAIGAPRVKGPMGAFRVKDRVRIEVDLVFA
ncbi:MAG: hypothetical protein ACLQVI_36465 [Polyangiaceae bacterium]|jgi:hypothetical protein